MKKVYIIEALLNGELNKAGETCFYFLKMVKDIIVEEKVKLFLKVKILIP